MLLWECSPGAKTLWRRRKRWWHCSLYSLGCWRRRLCWLSKEGVRQVIVGYVDIEANFVHWIGRQVSVRPYCPDWFLFERIEFLWSLTRWIPPLQDRITGVQPCSCNSPNLPAPDTQNTNTDARGQKQKKKNFYIFSIPEAKKLTSMLFWMLTLVHIFFYVSCISLS